VTLGGDADSRGAELGFRRLGTSGLRIDMADRLAAAALSARAARKDELIDPGFVTSLGLDEVAVARLMAELGFRLIEGAWKWRSRGRHAPPSAKPPPGHAFEALAGWRG
jgi:ATP-dependent RNA helicase SUPV3L1/SUV3